MYRWLAGPANASDRLLALVLDPVPVLYHLSSIDAFSYETIELLRDTAARWRTMRMIRDSAAFAANKDPAVAAALRVPAAELYAIDVSFAELQDKKELAYLNRLPTSFVLEPEAVDRLRAAGGTIIMESPEFKRLLNDLGVALVAQPPASRPPAP